MTYFLLLASCPDKCRTVLAWYSIDGAGPTPDGWLAGSWVQPDTDSELGTLESDTVNAFFMPTN